MTSHGETRYSAAQPLQPSEEPLSPAQVLSNTLSSFEEVDSAQPDIFQGDEVPPAVERQADPSFEDDKAEPESQNNSSPLSSLQALAEYDKSFDKLGELESLQESQRLVIEVDHSECQLNSEELLKKRVRDCLQFLITGLTTQLSHCGERVKSKHQHMASLQLSGFRDQTKDQSLLFFDFYLSSRIDWTPYRWLESRCIIQKYCSRSVPRVEEPGCGLIWDCEEAKERLCILLEEGQAGRLLRERDGAPCQASIATPTVSLAHLLKNGSFKHRYIPHYDLNYFLPLDRANLCLNLALSLLQLSQEEWRQIEWSPDNIFFLKDPVSGAVKDKTRPYLSWTVDMTPPGKKGSATTNEPTCDPHLLHFARLLMEIDAGDRIRATARGLELQKKLMKMIKDKNSHLARDSMFVAAIKSCLGNKTEGGSDEFQDFIYRDIVVNLERFAASNDTPSELSRSSTSSEQSAASDGGRALMSRYDGKYSKVPSSADLSRAARTFCKDMEAWRAENIVPLSKQDPPTTNLYSQQRIKIAVIDSGASKADVRILGASRRGVIKGGRNFLPSAAPNDWNDVNGHGTIVTSLLLDHAPNAEIYIAKVTDEVKIDSKGLFCVSQAINWAIQKWQVDIISMSIVLDREHEGIEEELAQVIDPSYEGPGISRKIVFAAAGNHGANAPIGWPAGRKGVIAIHATDGLGTATNISPTPDKKDDNFATLGCDIETELTLNGGACEEIYVTGTSFATPIAAAIAANVLEFSRHKLHLTLDRKRTLYTGPCIRRIFKKMAEERGGYRYLQPWTLWKREKDGICQVLLDAIAE